VKEHKRQNLNKYTKKKSKPNTQLLYNCRTQHSTDQFWLSSLLSSRQAPELRCSLLEGRGRRRVKENVHIGVIIMKLRMFNTFLSRLR